MLKEYSALTDLNQSVRRVQAVSGSLGYKLVKQDMEALRLTSHC